MIGVMAGGGSDVAVAQERFRGKDAVLSGDQCAHFFSQLVERFICGDTLAAKPFIEPLKYRLAAIVSANRIISRLTNPCTFAFPLFHVTSLLTINGELLFGMNLRSSANTSASMSISPALSFVFKCSHSVSNSLIWRWSQFTILHSQRSISDFPYSGGQCQQKHLVSLWVLFLQFPFCCRDDGMNINVRNVFCGTGFFQLHAVEMANNQEA